MNKLIWLPLMTIIVLALLSAAYVPGSSPIEGKYEEHNPGAVLEGETVTGTDLEMPTFTFEGMDMALVIVVAALAVGGIAGIRILGSGASSLSQSMIFLSIVYLGLWAVFSYVSFELFGAMATFGLLIWMILTILYVVGISQEVTGSVSGVD